VRRITAKVNGSRVEAADMRFQDGEQGSSAQVVYAYRGIGCTVEVGSLLALIPVTQTLPFVSPSLLSDAQSVCPQAHHHSHSRTTLTMSLFWLRLRSHALFWRRRGAAARPGVDAGGAPGARLAHVRANEK